MDVVLLQVIAVLSIVKLEDNLSDSICPAAADSICPLGFGPLAAATITPKK